MEYVLIIGKYGDSSEFYAPLWKYATMADAYVEEIHFRETSQLLTKREISAITGMIFLRILIQLSVWKTLSHLKAIFYFDSRPLGQKFFGRICF